jgi:DNA-binding protein Fis
VSLYALLSDVEDATAVFEAPPRLDPSPPVTPGSRSLEEAVLARLREYASSLQGHEAKDMYELIMPQLERPLVRVAMELANGRQRHAAEMLGIHRNTLRTRLKELGLDRDEGTKKRPRRKKKR